MKPEVEEKLKSIWKSRGEEYKILILDLIKRIMEEKENQTDKQRLGGMERNGLKH